MNSRNYGAPPHPKPWPEDEKYDQELLKSGDYRNVEDKYRYWTVEAIKTDLQKKSSNLDVAIENWQNDFNIGTIVRNANAFNVNKVHVIGRRHWNRRGAMVTDRYLEIEHHPTVDDFVRSIRGRKIIAVDNIPGAKRLDEVKLDKNAVLVFGGEGPGLSREMLARADLIVGIPQRGSTRSVNVGVASGILMYIWSLQNHEL